MLPNSIAVHAHVYRMCTYYITGILNLMIHIVLLLTLQTKGMNRPPVYISQLVALLYIQSNL